MKPAALTSLAFLLIVALAHLLRVIFAVSVTAGTVVVPMWPSELAVLGLAALAFWLWREQRTAPP